jgi:TIR domain
MKESRHILAYADRTFRLKGSISKGEKNDEEKSTLKPIVGLTPPFAYGSNQIRLYEICDKEDIVWIVGIAKHHGLTLPPMVVARLEVTEKLIRDQNPEKVPPHFMPQHNQEKDWSRYVVLADRQKSAYFPWNNCLEALLDLEFEGKNKSLRSCPHCLELEKQSKPRMYGGIGHHLQRIRLIKAPSHEALEKHAKDIVKRRKVFISYRWEDATPLALTLAEWLWDRGFTAWWDRCSMPRYATETKWDLNIREFTDALSSGIEQCVYFIILQSNRIEKSDWVPVEFAIAKNLQNQKKLKIIRLPNEGVLPSELAKAKDTEAVAEMLDQQLGPHLSA